MVNLETSITHRGAPEAKELESGLPLPLPHLARGPGRPRGSGCRRGHDGEQPRCRLRTGRAATTPCGRSARPDPGHRHRREPAGGLHAVPGLDPGHHLRVPRRDASFREGRAPSGPPVRRTAGHRRGPAARPRVLLDAVRAASRRDDVVVVYLHWGRGAPVLPHRPSSGSPRGRWPRPARTSWWAATHTSCSDPGGSATRTSTTAWATSSGTTTASRSPASSSCGSGTARWSVTPGRRPGSGPTAAPSPSPASGTRRGGRPTGDGCEPAPASRPDPRPHAPASGSTGPARAADGVHRDRPARSAPACATGCGTATTPGCPVAADRPALPPDDLRRLRRSRAHRRDGRAREVRRRGRRRLPPAVRRTVADPADAAGRRLPRRRRPVDGREQHVRLQLPTGRRTRHLVRPRVRRSDRHQSRRRTPTSPNGRPPAGRGAGSRPSTGPTHARRPPRRDPGRRRRGPRLRPDRLGRGAVDWSGPKDYQHFTALTR